MVHYESPAVSKGWHECMKVKGHVYGDLAGIIVRAFFIG